MINSIFISRALQDVPKLAAYCSSHGIRLQAQSLIRFEAVSTQLNFLPDVIFFSSIRAAQFYLANHVLHDSTAVACIGETTQKKLQELGIQVDFTGKKSGDPESVAHEFIQWVGQRKVLIPCSDKSNRSIASALPSGQYDEIVVYKTLPSSQNIEASDVYVFSSPSNVHSFLSSNSIPTNALLIAWGTTTQKALQDKRLSASVTLETSGEEELILALEKFL